jgi:hypothetical protein
MDEITKNYLIEEKKIIQKSFDRVKNDIKLNRMLIWGLALGIVLASIITTIMIT